MNHRRPSIKVATLLPGALLAAAVFGRWPYGFYTMMRLIVCGCCVYLAAKAHERRIVAWTWTLGAMAVLFNPSYLSA